METCKLEKIVRDVAALAGWEYKEVKPEHSQGWNRAMYKESAPGYKHGLVFNYDDHKNKVTISGTWERDNKNHQYVPSQYDIKDAGFNVASSVTGCLMPAFAYHSSITVSADKSAAQILKDIEKRFLPSYYKMYDHMMKRIEGSNKYITITANTLDVIKAVFGEQREMRQVYNNDNGVEVWSNKHDTRGSFVTRGKNVDVKISCDVETALAIAEILKKAIDKENAI